MLGGGEGGGEAVSSDSSASCYSAWRLSWQLCYHSRQTFLEHLLCDLALAWLCRHREENDQGGSYPGAQEEGLWEGKSQGLSLIGKVIDSILRF